MGRFWHWLNEKPPFERQLEASHVAAQALNGSRYSSTERGIIRACRGYLYGDCGCEGCRRRHAMTDATVDRLTARLANAVDLAGTRVALDACTACGGWFIPPPHTGRSGRPRSRCDLCVRQS